MSVPDAAANGARAQGQAQPPSSSKSVATTRLGNGTTISEATAGPSTSRGPPTAASARTNRDVSGASSSRFSTGSGSVNSHPGRSNGAASNSLRDGARPTSPAPSSSNDARRANNRGNRLSGFFSGLRPRPQTMPPTPLVPPKPTPPTPTPAPKPKQKAPEPLPPSLEAPTLRDLGLSLNVLTPALYPSHYATPPTSGTFMQPHFLLLCHSQGLDVLPLVGPPASQAYALIRRVAFKSVVVMEERGVLVAIAGRRDGVRVYALEDVRRAIEWRMEMEVQREEEKAKKDGNRIRTNSPALDPRLKNMQPRAATLNPPKPLPAAPIPPSEPPPNYSSPHVPTIALDRQQSARSNATSHNGVIVTPPSPGALAEPVRPSRDRGMSVSSIVQARMLVGNTPGHTGHALNDTQEEKNEWLEGEGSDEEEALVAAGPSGSAALDERTSSMPAATSNLLVPNATGDIPELPEEGSENEMDGASGMGSTVPPSSRTATSAASIASDPATPPPRRPRPASLHLRAPTTGPPGPPSASSREGDVELTPPASPSPTVFSLQRSLSQGPPLAPSSPPARQYNERITFTQALMESRLPSAPPLNPATLRTDSSTAYDPDGSPDPNVDSEEPQTPTSRTMPPPTTPRSTIPPNANSNITPGRRSSSTTIGSASDRRTRRRWSFLGAPEPAQRAVSRTGGVTRSPSQELPRAPPSSMELTNGGARTAPINGPNGRPAVHRSPSMPGTPTRSRPPSRTGSRLQRITSHPGLGSSSHDPNPRSASSQYNSPSTTSIPNSTNASNNPNARTPNTPRRFARRLFGAFRSSNHDRNGSTPRNGLALEGSSDTDTDRPLVSSVPGAPEPGTRDENGAPVGPPRMEFVKLPGTHKSLMIKAVETAKKSFLAILCGENGEKVELFAGTYRTALGLSRTFILPDSPRSLELQLQGDDLVELFLMFNQNVFGLEPATVRVREVRIGRAERRARRRAAARENELLGGEGTGEGRDGMTSLDGPGTSVQDTQVITTVMAVGEDGESPQVVNSTTHPAPSEGNTVRAALQRRGSGRSTRGNGTAAEANAPSRPAAARAPSPSPPVAAPPHARSHSLGEADSVAPQPSEGGKPPALPYSTFQQLSFAPNFPLAIIADEYVIPPTYLDFVGYQKQYEVGLDIVTEIPTSSSAAPESDSAAGAETNATGDTAESGPAKEGESVPKEPPGLDKAATTPRWVYKDPKGILRGPWDADIMQNWLRDGYLPPNLPIRRENETEFMTLKEYQEAHPDVDDIFRLPSSTVNTPSSSRPQTPNGTAIPTSDNGPSPWIPVPNVLLPPTSLLQQPRYFGPPALFFSTRGGHSTAIVDARGRSVLKGRVLWSADDTEEGYELIPSTLSVLGDVKRVEAFDTRDQRAVVVALRQGGLEAVDMGDALFQPGDESRPFLPMYVSPNTSTARRKNWTWYLGSAVEDLSTQYFTPFGLVARRETALARRSGPNQNRAPTMTDVRGMGFSPTNQQQRPRREDVVRDRKDPRAVTPQMSDEDILFLGRHRDRVYMCERNADSFRILCLSPLE